MFLDSFLTTTMEEKASNSKPDKTRGHPDMDKLKMILKLLLKVMSATHRDPQHGGYHRSKLIGSFSKKYQVIGSALKTLYELKSDIKTR